MIKIVPLLANEFKQASILLKLQDDLLPLTINPSDIELFLHSLAIWQHWLPCTWHTAPSVYVAKEDNNIIGLISLKHTSKSRGCWQIDKLVVHPEHRGRGIAQELLRYVFAQFGSQGVTHFLAEVPANNDAALSLFANCGFCRSSRLSFYKLNLEQHKTKKIETGKSSDNFRQALPYMRQAIFQLYSDVLPATLRQVLLLSPDDFEVKEVLPFTSVEKSREKFMRTRVWYWISEDSERKVLSSAVKVTAEPERGYKLEFFVHPGWKEMSNSLVSFTLSQLTKQMPKALIWAKVYDFQQEIHTSILEQGFERSGESFLLLREHWQRSRNTKRASLPNIGNPAINFPLTAERKQ